MNQKYFTIEFYDFINELANLAEKHGFNSILDPEGTPHRFIVSEIEDWFSKKSSTLEVSTPIVTKVVSIAERQLLKLESEEVTQDESEEDDQSSTEKDFLCEDDEGYLESLMELYSYLHDPPDEYYDPPEENVDQNIDYPEELDYSGAWAKVSEKYKTSVGWICENCGVDAASDKILLHTHHLDQDKTNNNPENMCALCVLCHSDQPKHGFMKKEPNFENAKERILKLRRRNA